MEEKERKRRKDEGRRKKRDGTWWRKGGEKEISLSKKRKGAKTIRGHTVLGPTARPDL